MDYFCSRKLWALLLVLTATPYVFAATPTSAERSMLTQAQNWLGLTFPEKAEKILTEFCQTYTNSSLMPEAILYQARARFGQSNYVGAAELLLSHFNARDPLADD